MNDQVFTGPIRRRNHGGGHSYPDANNVKVPGVTTCLSNGLPKPALVNWAADTTANKAVDCWDELSALPPSQRLKRLRKARFEDRDAAANKGTRVHDLAEQLVAGQAVDPPEEIRGHVEAYVQFLDDWNVQPVAVELVIASYSCGYAGTADLVADLTDPDDEARQVRWLLDIKTNRSGVFGDVALQLAAYRYADTYQTPDGVELPMIPVARTGVVHVRADGYSLVPVEAGQWQHRQFRYVQQVARFCQGSRDLVGEALQPPSRKETSA